MISEIKKETQTALNKLKSSKLSLRKKDLLRQMTQEIESLMQEGEWDFAVRLSHYRHEFAKTSKNQDWYPPFLQIRKTRDRIKLLAGGLDGDRRN